MIHFVFFSALTEVIINYLIPRILSNVFEEKTKLLFFINLSFSILLIVISIITGIIAIINKSKVQYNIRWWMVIAGLIISFISIIQLIAGFFLLSLIKKSGGFWIH